MEDTVFPRSAVAELLESQFVEARIHTDHKELGAEQRALQTKMVGFVAAPYYVIVDPNNPDAKVAEHRLQGVADGWDRIRDKFEVFLREAVEAKGMAKANGGKPAPR